MKKNIIVLLVVFLTHIGAHLQAQENTTEKIIKALINHEYTTYESPIQINYKVYVYGGSGNFTYKWRIQGKDFDAVTANTFSTSFSCSTDKKPEQVVFCEVKDLETHQIVIAKTKHPVEFCIQ